MLLQSRCSSACAAGVVLRPDGRAQPHRPRLHARDRQDPARPGICREAGPNLRFATRVDNEKRVVTVPFAEAASHPTQARARALGAFRLRLQLLRRVVHATANTIEMLALYLGMMDADFTVTEPPELLARLTKLATRFSSAVLD